MVARYKGGWDQTRISDRGSQTSVEPPSAATGSGLVWTDRFPTIDGDNLVYVGRVGTGWDRKKAAAIRKALAPLARKTRPLAKPMKRKDTT